nr:PD-(D/E)XK nuclease family protein [uncultured Dethiosulfovibrio sp.]
MPIEILSYRSLRSLDKGLLDLYSDKPDSTFVVPASEDREWLKDILLAQGSFGSESFRIYRWDELYRELCPSEEGKAPLIQIDPPDHWLALNGLTSELIARWGDRLPPGVAQSGFISSLGAMVRELIREEVPVDALLEGLFHEGEERPEDPSWILTSLYGEYCDLLRSKKLMDSAAISTEIAALIAGGIKGLDWLVKRPLVLVGFYSFNHSQLGMVRAMVKDGLDLKVFSPVAGLLHEYGSLAQLEGASVKEFKSPPPGMFSILGGNGRHELETVARELVLWEKGLGSIPGDFPSWDRIAMATQPRSVSLAVEVLSRYGIPFNLAKGRTVADTVLWDTVRKAWDCHRDRWQPGPTAELLCLPWMVPEGDESALARASARGIKEWKRLVSGDEKLTFALQSVARFCKLLSSGGDCKALLQGLKDLAYSMDWGKSLSAQVEDVPDLDRSVLDLGSAVRELERKLSKIEELQTDLGEAAQKSLKGGDAMAFLSVWAESSTVWPGPTRRGSMTLYPGSPPVMAHYDTWIMTEATGKNWPGTLVESPLLRESQREELHSMDLRGSRLDRTHLPLLSEKRAQKEVLFRRLMACGDRLVILSRPSVDGSGRPLMEASFVKNALEDRWVTDIGSLDRSDGRVLPQWTEKALSPSEVHQPPAGSYSFRPDREFPKDSCPLPNKTIPLSSVDRFATCPFMFRCYSEGLFPPDLGGFNAALAGTAMHEIMNRSWKAYIQDESVPFTALVDRLWEPVLEEVYRSMVVDRDLSRRKELFYSDLISGATLIQAMEQNGLRERRVESLSEMDLPPLAMDNVTFTGKADRVDLLVDGRVILWDYKSGNSAFYSRSLQLAAYGLLLAEREPEPLEIGGYGFIGFRSGSVTGYADDDLSSLMGLSVNSRKAPLEERLDEARSLLEDLDRAVGEDDFSPNYESPACSRCGYVSLCRRGELRRKDDYDDDSDR